MKKISGFVIAALSLLMVAGCTQDQYAIEREHWRLKKQFQSIVNNPAATPPNEVDRAVSALAKFVNRYPKNILALQSDLMISSIYIAKEDFGKARAQLNAMLKKYDNPEIKSQVTFLIGNAYELQKKWDDALTYYKKVLSEYPITGKGIEVPLYIAGYYKKNFQPEKMRAALDEAVSHYTALAEKYPLSPLALKSYTLISACYGEIKDWPRAIAALETILEKFKGKTRLDGVMFDIALIYKRELKNEVKAREMLQRIAKEYPNTQAGKTAEKILSDDTGK